MKELFFGLPDFMVLTLIFPLGLGVLVAFDAMGRGQSNEACIVWFLFTWILWPIALPVYYLIVIERYRGLYRTSSGIKAGAGFLILLIITTAYAGVALPRETSPKWKATPTETSLPCEIVGFSYQWAPDWKSITTKVTIRNWGGDRYVPVEYYTNTGVILHKEYLKAHEMKSFSENIPWSPKYQWIEVRIVY